MIKKIACIVIALICLFTLVACETNNGAEGCAHTLGDWDVTANPTCVQDGSRQRRCTICYEVVVVEAINRLPHNDSDANCVCDGCNQAMHSFIEGECEHCGKLTSQVYNHVDSDQSGDITTGDIIYLGQYPSTLVTDAQLKTDLLAKTKGYPTLENFRNWTDYGYYVSQKQKTFMWYIDVEYNDGAELRKFRGVYFIEYRPYYTACGTSDATSHQDDNGYFVKTLYWFEYQPLAWNVLVCEDGAITLVSDQIIDSQAYNYTIEPQQINGVWYYTSNYMHSSIRKWLNKDFYDTAFTLEQSQVIQTTLVDNGKASTNPFTNPTHFNKGKNPYVCADTQDAVFLLSRSQLSNPEFGFAEMNVADLARCKTATDYAKSQGLYVYTGDKQEYFNTGHWFMRSPHYDYSSCVGVVNSTGDGSKFASGFADGYYYTHNTNIGVVPAIVIGA